MAKGYAEGERRQFGMLVKFNPDNSLVLERK
jgi:hypothetical protein